MDRRILVLGMGNPVLSDDAVGLVVAGMLAERLPWASVESSFLVGLGLLDIVEGYDELFLVDAMTTGEAEPGTLRVIRPGDDVGTDHLFTSHGIDVYSLLALGTRSGLQMPEIKRIYGIEIGPGAVFGESLSDGLLMNLDRLCGTIAVDISSTVEDNGPVGCPVTKTSQMLPT